jgi:hypothetical protein
MNFQVDPVALRGLMRKPGKSFSGVMSCARAIFDLEVEFSQAKAPPSETALSISKVHNPS